MGNYKKNRSRVLEFLLKLVLACVVFLLIYEKRVEIGMFLVNWNNDTAKSTESGVMNSNDYASGKEISTTASIGEEDIVLFPQSDEDAGMYRDSRVPNPVEIANCFKNVVEREYAWKSHDYIYSFSITFNLYESLYKYYKGLDRYYDVDMLKYIEDPTNLKIVDQLVESLNRLADSSDYSEDAKVREAINFVQNLAYLEDEGDNYLNEWPKYPIETLYDKGGDCEDHAILLGAMLKQMGYGCAFVLFDDHVGIGISGSDDMPGAFYTYGGVNYFYVETTYPEWKIGEIPDDYRDVEARVIVIN